MQDNSARKTPQDFPLRCVPPTPQPLDFAIAKDKRNGYGSATFTFAQSAEHARILAMKEMPEQFSTLPFSEAVPLWLNEEEIYHADKPKTMKSYRDYVARLLMIFRDIPLAEIHIGHLREYQRTRKSDYHPRSINNDLGLLSRVLKKAGLWKPLSEIYRPLPVPRWTPPRVLTEKEEQHLFDVAAKNPDYELAYWVASLTNNTSASGSELRGLKIKNVDMCAVPPIVYVPSDKVKNEFRARVIPLNERGATQMNRLLDRARRCGSTGQEHYLFPLRTRSGKRPEYDPTRPASESFLRKQWDKMRKEAGFPWLRPHDMRHQIITKLLENGVPEQTVMSIAGHVSREMLEHYSHQRVDAKARALDIIDPDRKKNVAPVGKRATRGVRA
jgi:integrase